MTTFAPSKRVPLAISQRIQVRQMDNPIPADVPKFWFNNNPVLTAMLAEQLLAEPRDKIYITYGAKHLPGVFKLLHTADPRWHSVSIKWMRTVDEPENYMDKSPI